MTLVILSRHSLAASKARTIGAQTFVGLLLLSLLVVLGFGMYAGSRLFAPAPVVQEVLLAAAPPQAEEAPLAPPLAEHIGELSARMLELERQASWLAEHMSARGEWESRARGKPDAAPEKAPAKKQPPAAGGPLLRPRKDSAEAAGDDITHLLPDLPPLALPPYSALRHADMDAHQGLLHTMQGDLEYLDGLLEQLAERVRQDSLAQMSFPGRMPVRKSVRVSGFGNRLDPFRRVWSHHDGIDFAAPKGTPIMASAGGTVVQAATHSAYGKTVRIDHGMGLETRYAHMSEIMVRPGEVVLPGQQIGKVGSTGRSTGPHLHFEILKDGKAVNPATYLARF